MSGTVLKSLKGIAAHMPLSRQARLVRFVVPRQYWFRAALSLCRTHGALVDRMGGNGRFTTAVMLDFWIRELTFGGHFPIPYRLHGKDIVQIPGPRLYTWTHLPLTEVPLRAALENGVDPPTVVADAGNIVEDGKLLVSGFDRRMDAIPVNEQLLLRVRSRLAAGRPVVFLADQFLGGPLSDIPLRLAARMKLPVVFQWAELAADGVVDVTFRFAPHPVIQTAEQLQENLEFLRQANEAALARLGWRPSRSGEN